METKLRSFIKAVSWRILGSLFTMGVVWAFTRQWKAAAAVGIIDTLAKIIIFYVHERLWLRISFGKRKGSEYQI